MPEVGQAVGVRELTLAQAINEALAEEMRRDPRVFIIGEDVAEAGTPFKVLKGLVEEFGPERVIDSPISEAGITGIGLGAAMTGMHPVVDIMFGDFLTLAMDQLVNQAAKVRYMSAGGFCAPLVLRTAIGVGGNLGPQHSQSFHAWVAHIPGLKVVMPATARDAKGLIKAAIRDDDPVVFFENRALYNLKGPVPDGDYVVPLGVAEVKRAGTDVTIVAVGAALQIAAKAAVALAERGVSVEIVDPRTLVPLDIETILASVRKTSRALVLDLGHQSFGVTGELASTIGALAFDYLDAPIERLGAPDVPVPFARSLEPLSMPTAEQVVERILRMFGSRAER